MPKVKNLFDDLWLKIKETTNEYKELRKPFLILALIYGLGISAILRANINYVDDMGRVNLGYKGWENFGRYISGFLSNFIHADTYLTDVSPLPQLIAVLFLAVAGIIVLYVITGKKTFRMIELISVVPLGLSPYFLECLSYKYDSPYMALSILGAVFPLLFYNCGHKIYTVMSVVGSLIVCMTYQPATGIFPMLVVLMSLKAWNNKEDIREILKKVGTSIVGYCIGLIVFRVFIMNTVDSYVSTSTVGIREFIPKTIKNLLKYFSLVKSDFKIEWLILIALLCIAFIYVLTRDSKQEKRFVVPMNIFMLIVMALLSFGVYPVLADPLYDPRAMYGFGAFIAFVGILVANAKKVYLAKFACVALSWAFFVFSFTYGNALYEQSKYTDFRISEAVDDLKELEAFNTDEVKTVQIKGSMGQALPIWHMPQDYQILNRLIPVTFENSSWSWAWYQFGNYYGLKNIAYDSSIDLRKYNLPVVEDTMYHTIRGNDKYILIELK